MNSSSKIIAGVLAGVAAGAVLGLLFAPEKGEDTRRRISEKYNDLRLLGDVLAQDAEIKLAQGQSEEGINLFNRAVENLHQTDAKDRLAKVYFRYASGLEKLGKLQDAIQIYRKAYEYQKQGN